MVSNMMLTFKPLCQDEGAMVLSGYDMQNTFCFLLGTLSLCCLLPSYSIPREENSRNVYKK